MATLSEALREGGAERLTLSAARYRFDFRVTEPIDLPDYSGSTIRGAFGGALRRTACMTRMPDCKACPLYRSCPYTAVFETPPPESHELQKFTQIPNAYVIEPPRWGRHGCEAGERFSFRIVLIGRAREHLALVIYAMQRAFSFHVAHGRAELEGVSIERSSSLGDEELVYAPGFARVAAHENSTTLAIPRGDRATLRVETPLRLQNNGKALRPGEIGAHAFMMALMRRVSLLSEFQMGEALELDFRALSAAADGIGMRTDLVWKDWTRYSSRQERRMNFGGVVGAVELEGVPAPFLTLLSAGQMLHFGKNATFGLGKYALAGGLAAF